jgi:NAD(P)H-nitrite reductase large subunit
LQYVIIGNGGAGISALQALRDVDKKSEVILISREQYPAYSPCSLPNLISGELEQPRIFRFDKKFYQQHHVIFIKNTEALQICPKDKFVKLSNKQQLPFDKLLIAAGASPITPKSIVGLELNGVHVMDTLDSTLDIVNHVKQGVIHAVVIGGGFMGIETATMLTKRGIKVSIVEKLPQILLRMLDTDMSKRVAQIVTEKGINLICNNSVQTIEGKKHVSKVILQKRTLSCDMVVVAIGVAPNTTIVQNSGIATNHGIIVDSTMQTNIKDIYAAGDIAEVREQIGGKQGSYAIWPNAIEQGRIAGLNMANKHVTYPGAEVVNVLDVFDIPIVAMGFTSNDIRNYEVISRFTPNSSKKLLIQNNRIVGLQYIGSLRNVGTFYGLMKKGTDIHSIKERILDDNFVITPDSIPDEM